MSIPLPVSGAAGQVWWDGAGNGDVGRTGTNGNSGWSSTWLDLTKIKRRLGEPEGKKVKSILLRHWNTGFSTHSPKSTNTRQKWRYQTFTGSYRQQRNHHLYGTKASQGTCDITWGGIYRHPLPKGRGDATCKGQPEDADHSPVFGLSCTGRWIRRASRANACIQSSTWIPMDPNKKSWHRLRSPLIDFPAITDHEWSRGNGTDDYGSGIKGLGSRIQKCQRVASGERSGYTDTRINCSWRSSS